MALTPLQEDILVHLHTAGDDLPVNIAESADAHRNSVVRAMRGLEDDGLVRNKGHGVYRLTKTGRETAIDLISGD